MAMPRVLGVGLRLRSAKCFRKWSKLNFKSMTIKKMSIIRTVENKQQQ